MECFIDKADYCFYKKKLDHSSRVKMISFSGIDCSGKSTQIEKIEHYLQNNPIFRIKVIHSRIGYTPGLEFVKSIIRKDRHATSKEKQQYREKIHSSSRKRRVLLWLSIFDIGLFYCIFFRLCELFGITILADRYFWDSYIDLKMKYSEFPFEKWIVWKLFKKFYLKPKKAIIYVIPAELSMYRSTLKDEPWPETVEVRKERIAHYIAEIKKKRWDCVIDATGSIESVFEQTIKCLDL